MAAAPVAAQSSTELDGSAALRPRPLPAALTPEAPATAPRVEFLARGGRPVWLLPAAGMVAGAILYPVLVDGGCDDTDCMLYIPEPVTGALVGLLGGITLEVILRLVTGDLPASLLPLSTREPSAIQPGTRLLH